MYFTNIQTVRKNIFLLRRRSGFAILQIRNDGRRFGWTFCVSFVTNLLSKHSLISSLKGNSFT